MPDSKPVIFCFCNGAWSRIGGGVVAIAEDGTFLASHFSSNESFAQGDIGFRLDGRGEPWATAQRKFAIYQEHYPDGYVLEWVDNPDEHAGVQLAAERNREQARAAGEHGTGVFVDDGEGGMREATKTEMEQAEIKGDGGYAI